MPARLGCSSQPLSRAMALAIALCIGAAVTHPAWEA